MIPKTSLCFKPYKSTALDMITHLISIYNLTEPVRFAHLEIIAFSFEDWSPLLLVFGYGGFQAFLGITAAHPRKCDHLLHNVSVARVSLAYTLIHVYTRASAALPCNHGALHRVGSHDSPTKPQALHLIFREDRRRSIRSDWPQLLFSWEQVWGLSRRWTLKRLSLSDSAH